MSRPIVVLALICLLLLGSARPALAQGKDASPAVTLIPLTCRLCETRVSPDGKIAAVFENRDIAGGEWTAPSQIAITLIDTTNGKTLGRLSGQTDYAGDVAFSPDSRYLAALHSNGSLRLWEVKGRKLIWERFAGIGSGRVAFSADGQTIAASRAGIPNSIWLIDRRSAQVGPVLTWRFNTLSEFMDLVSDAKNSIGMTFSAWALSPDGQQVAAATFNDEIWLFDAENGAATQVLAGTGELGQGSIRQIGYTPDGQSLYFSDTRSHTPRIWSLETMTETFPAPASDPASEEDADRVDPEQVDLTAYDLYGLTLSPDGETFAWADQAPGPDDREQPLIMTAAVDEWPQAQTVVSLLPDNLRAVFATRVFFTPDRRLIAGGFMAADEQNVLVVVEP